MDAEKIQDLYEEKYQKVFGMPFAEWQNISPQTEQQAYERLNQIDKELNRTYDLWFDSAGEERDNWEDYRDKLKAEYDFLETSFGLEAQDKDY